MKIVFNGVQLTVAKGTSINLANGIIEVNTQPTTKTKKAVATTKPSTTVAEVCRSMASKLRKGSEVIIRANNDNAIRYGFDTVGMRVSIKTTANPEEFRVRMAK